MRRALARAAALLEPAVVILAAPLLWFPTLRPAWTAAALGALLAVWLLRWIATGRPGARSPFDLALLLFVLMIPIGVWASALPALTLPRLTELILGLAAYRAVVNAIPGPPALRRAALLFLALGLGLTLVGLVGASWPRKIPALETITAPLPQIRGLPDAERGINPNVLAGGLVLFFPVALAAGLAPGTAGRRLLSWLRRGALLLLALLLLAVLLLAQSRSAWLATLAALAIIAWLRWPPARWPIVAAALLVGTGLLGAGLAATAGPSDLVDAAGWIDRLPIWQHALSAIRAFPFTGAGLGTFGGVAYLFEPHLLTGPDGDIAHAHNLFLQVAYDLGLPGLVAYLALSALALWICWRVARTPQHPHAWLATGLAGSLIAFYTYGLTNTSFLAAKPGVFFWPLLALVAALCRISPARGVDPR